MSNKEMGLRTVFVDKRATSRQLQKAKLVVIDGEDSGQEFTVEKSKVYVGRSKVNDITLKDKSISSTHFELRAEEDGFLLRDLGSGLGRSPRAQGRVWVSLPMITITWPAHFIFMRKSRFMTLSLTLFSLKRRWFSGLARIKLFRRL